MLKKISTTVLTTTSTDKDKELIIKITEKS